MEHTDNQVSCTEIHGENFLKFLHSKIFDHLVLLFVFYLCMHLTNYVHC